MSNLLGGAGRQKLQIVALIPRNTPRQEDGINLSVLLDKFADVLLVLVSKSVSWAPLGVAVYPCLKANTLIVVLEGLKS